MRPQKRRSRKALPIFPEPISGVQALSRGTCNYRPNNDYTFYLVMISISMYFEKILYGYEVYYKIVDFQTSGLVTEAPERSNTDGISF